MDQNSTTPKLTRWRRPRKIIFPGGYVVPIVFWSKRAVRKAMDPKSETDLMGYWDGKQIVINRDQPLYTQIETLGHEVVHAAHDWALWYKLEFADHIKQEMGESYMAMSEEE